MVITYKKIFKFLNDHDFKKRDLADKAKISPATINKMAAGDNVTMEIVEKFRRTLDVKVDDISEFVD